MLAHKTSFYELLVSAYMPTPISLQATEEKTVTASATATAEATVAKGKTVEASADGSAPRARGASSRTPGNAPHST